MRIIHFADVHFEEKNHAEIKRCMESMINSIGTAPDAIICSGDVTNSQYLGADTKSAKTIAEQFRRLSDIAPVAVVVGTPSHDGNTPELLRYVSGRYPIHVSSKPEQIYLDRTDTMINGTCKTDYSWTTDPGNRVELIVTQIPAPTKEHWQNRQGAEADNQNIAQAMASIFSGFGHAAREAGSHIPHILNGHFSMKGSKISETQTLPGADIAIDTETLSMANADLYCLGHIHFAQEYHLPGGKKAYHSGSIFRKDFGEQGHDKGFYVHYLGEWPSEFIPVPTRAMIQIDYDFLKKPELLQEDLADQIIHDLNSEIKAGNSFWVKIRINIWIDEIRKINQARIKAAVIEAGAENVIMEINRIRRENSREETILKAESLVDKVRALAEHRCTPAPAGVFEMMEKVESLSLKDLVEYGKNRLNPVEPEQIINESEKEREVA